MEEIENLLDLYEKKKNLIKLFINSCDIKDDECLFGELCFCILTPQSRAKNCRKVVEKLKKENKLFNVNLEELRKYLKNVRFPNVKAKRIIEARKNFPEIKKKLNLNPHKLREWLIKNVKGIGLKESAHFMRNIGFRGLPIIDAHIQNFLKKIGIFKRETGNITKKQYLKLEEKFLELSRELQMKPEELDIAIWLYQSGENSFYG